ncbi:MAG: hypothetical protein U1D31_02785 [Patescibacteria group bacterium]|nr:hypothetical protein [bacterium]MDZ4241018.1 hypothetical protein [Patescibacteria group bacterium]
MKYSNLDLGTIEAVINKLGGIEGVKQFLSGELTVSKPDSNWREKDDFIFFSTLTLHDGVSPKWIKCLEEKGFRIGDCLKATLRSDGLQINLCSRVSSS